MRPLLKPSTCKTKKTPNLAETAPRDRRPLRVAAPSSTRCDRSAPTPRCRLLPPSAVDIDEGRAAAVALHSRGSAHRFAGRFQVAPTAVRSYLGDGGLEQPADERSSDQEEDKESDEAVRTVPSLPSRTSSDSGAAKSDVVEAVTALHYRAETATDSNISSISI